MASKRQYTAAVLGAAGGIGQPLSLLLNQCDYVKELHLYDVVPVVAGVAVDISHIETGVTVKGYPGDFKNPDVSKEQLHACLEGVDICVIPAGLPRKPGMTRDDLFGKNADIISGLVEAIAEVCPKAMICIISNPVNSTVPIAAEILKQKGCYDPKRLFGISTLDIVRSNKFIAEKAGLQPEDVNVTVIGGHSGKTILPLLSQCGAKLSDADIEALTARIQSAGTEVVEAKAGGGSATLSMAYAGARFATSVMKGMAGEANIVECTYVESSLTELPFFASPVLLGKNGIEKVMPFSNLSSFEEAKLKDEVIPDLKAAIDKGVEYAN